MAIIKLDEAAKCPKCGQVGELGRNKKERYEGKLWDISTYICVTEGCKWYGTGWTVQSDENGVVYQRPQGERGQDKTFRRLTPGQEARARAQIEDAIKREFTNDPRGGPNG